MARVAANVSLQLAMRTPMRNLSRTHNKYLYVSDMCALSADEVLLSCGAAGLRSVSPHTAQLAAHEPSAIRYVWRVVFDAHTDTLLLAVSAPTGNYYQLVSLRRNASEWLEVQRLSTRIHYNLYNIFNFVVCDSRVLLGDVGGNTLNVLDVSAEHTLRDVGNVTLQSGAYGVACTRRDGATFVALSHFISVSLLLQLTSLPLRLVPLASVNLTAAHELLFLEDLLLVQLVKDDLNRATRSSHAIVSLRASDYALTEPRVLLNFPIDVWALAGDRLVLWDYNSQDLLVYTFT